MRAMDDRRSDWRGDGVDDDDDDDGGDDDDDDDNDDDDVDDDDDDDDGDEDDDDDDDATPPAAHRWSRAASDACSCVKFGGKAADGPMMLQQYLIGE